MKKYYNYQIKKVVSVTDLKTIEKLDLYAGFRYPSEEHNFFEFVYVIEGKVFCLINNDVEELQEDEFRLILPNTIHSYHAKKPAKIYIVCFKCKSVIMEIIDKKIKLGSSKSSLIHRIFEEAEKSFEFPFHKKIALKEQPMFGAQQLVENLIEELLIELLRNNMEDLKPVKDNYELQDNILEDIIVILKDNLYGHITLSEVSKKLYYSTTYLNNLFRNRKGTTIMKYYTALKLEESKNLLNAGLSTSEIAEKLCFEDSNYFRKVFKKHYGITPFQYKKGNVK